MNDVITEDRRYYAYVMNQLHRWNLPPEQHWTPHLYQRKIIKALFADGTKTVFIQCGRKWGKSEIICYTLWRWALFNPNSACYYFAPQKDDAAEIIWNAFDQSGRRRLPEFGPGEFIRRIYESEMRIEFKNGSFILVDGSDNISAVRGYSPAMYVADEYADFDPLWEGEMEPNRATFDAPALYVGTPPRTLMIDMDTPHHYVQKAEITRRDMAEGGSSLWVKRPSWDNPLPHIQNFLRRKKEECYRFGREADWLREYEAELVEIGERKIFPNFNSNVGELGSHVIHNGDMLDFLNGTRFIAQ
jgi:hypothetical protein